MHEQRSPGLRGETHNLPSCSLKEVVGKTTANWGADTPAGGINLAAASQRKDISRRLN